MVSDSRVKCASTGHINNTDEWLKVTRRGVALWRALYVLTVGVKLDVVGQ